MTQTIRMRRLLGKLPPQARRDLMETRLLDGRKRLPKSVVSLFSGNLCDTAWDAMIEKMRFELKG